MKKITQSFVLILISIVLVSCGQSRQEKTEDIITKLKLVENQKTGLSYMIEPVKSIATGKDSAKIVELEKLLSDAEIVKRISKVLNEVLSDKELNDINKFVNSSAYEKFFNSGALYKEITAQFKDVNDEIENIKKNFDKPEKPRARGFEPIPVEREDGFYATVNYKSFSDIKNVQLEKKPALTTNDISKVVKEKAPHTNIYLISIDLTKDGAKKFYILTKENIEKPIAIVVGNHIVSLPIVNAPILGGKAQISGNFTEAEIDAMIEILQKK